jgi:surfeit locus 1 family protein
MSRARSSLSGAARLTIVGLAALLFTAFCALGTWQVQRRAWKLALIERVEQRVRAEPVAPPGPERWASISVAQDEYRRVRVTGRFLHQSETLVQAVTELGAGYWVLTPLATEGGTVLLVNRGFVPPARRTLAEHGGAEPAGPVAVTGLLRLTEPKGGFLRENDPGAERWFSRDVAAIAAARGLQQVAPYFIDAEHSPGPEAAPRGGLTVIQFPNTHAAYAFTWYTLALMVAGAAWWLLRAGPGDTRRDSLV